MRASTLALLLILGGAIAALTATTDLIAHRSPRSPDARADHPTLAIARPVGNLSLGEPRWQHAGGLLVGELTLTNGNDYSVSNVVIACELLDRAGKLLDAHRTAIRRVFEPGQSLVDGIEFVRFARDLQGGACRIVSAQPARAARNEVE
jgi:hypothetical protein